MSDKSVIAAQAAQIARLRDAVRMLLPVVRFHDPNHPGVKLGEKLMQEVRRYDA